MRSKLIVKIFALVFTVAIFGCSSDEQVERSLNGEWVEVYPQMERTTLIFSSSSNMRLIDEDGNSQDFNFRIDGDEIFLSPVGSDVETPLSFNKLDPMRFNIGDLYPSIPESDPERFMTFEKI